MSPFQLTSHCPPTYCLIQFRELLAFITLACMLAARRQIYLLAGFSYSFILWAFLWALNAWWLTFFPTLSLVSLIPWVTKGWEISFQNISKLGSRIARWLNIQHKQLLQHLKSLRNSSRSQLFPHSLSLSLLSQLCKIPKISGLVSVGHF